jgi:hypothetical protein
MALFLGIETEIKWMKDIVATPILGHIFLFVIVFVPAVILSFILYAVIPPLNNDIGFAKVMLLLLPVWNIGLWICKIRVFILFIPTWLLFGIIAIIKGYLMFKGIDNGQ